MKRFYSVILFFSFVTGVLQPFIPALEYHLLKDYIIEHHCMNKDNPEMECDGMCYLTKKIDETHSNHDDHTMSANINYYPGAILNVTDSRLMLFPVVKEISFTGIFQSTDEIDVAPPLPPPK